MTAPLFSIQPWSVYQRDARGAASITVRGDSAPLRGQAALPVFARLCLESSAAPAAAHLEHMPLDVGARTWSLTLRDVPVGGPYRLELYGPGTYACVHGINVGDIWVVAGQSNIAGYSAGLVEDAPQLGVYQFTINRRWQIAAHPLGDGWGHSPALAFGKLLHKALGVPIALVPLAVGGSALSQWNPAEGDAPLYRRMLDIIRALGCPVKGMLWYQGCSDAAERVLTQSYRERFQAYISRLREDLRQPDLPVLTTQLNRQRGPADAEADYCWSLLREQQALCARTIPRVAIIPSHDLSLSDAIHTSAGGNLTLAARYADAALSLAYGGADCWRAPELASATLNPSRDRVSVAFAHVPVGLVAVSEVIGDFCVEDAQGVIPYTVPDRYLYYTNTVVLRLVRPALPGAWIRLCYGRDPVSTLRRYRDMTPPLACMQFTLEGE